MGRDEDEGSRVVDGVEGCKPKRKAEGAEANWKRFLLGEEEAEDGPVSGGRGRESMGGEGVGF